MREFREVFRKYSFPKIDVATSYCRVHGIGEKGTKPILQVTVHGNHYEEDS